MQLVQIFLPLYDNNKQLFQKSFYDELRNKLKDKFGGVTLYRNTAAEGLWKDETGKTNYDELIIAEVMIETLDKEWWMQFKQTLEQIFTQNEILIRSLLFEKL
jgi:hypothetical protein